MAAHTAVAKTTWVARPIFFFFVSVSFSSTFNLEEKVTMTVA